MRGFCPLGLRPRSPRRRSRWCLAGRVRGVACAVVEGIIALLGGSSRQLSLFSPGLTRRMAAHVVSCARAFVWECRAGVGGGLPKRVGGRTPFVAARLALPAFIPVARVVDMLPPELAVLLSVEGGLLLAPDPAPEVVAEALRPKGFFGDPAEFEEFCRRALAGGLARPLGADRVRGRVSVFVVPKDDSTERLILNCTAVNELFVVPESLASFVRLATPEHLAGLEVPAAGAFFASKMDLSAFYHSVVLPTALHPFFTLPRLSAAAKLRLGVRTDLCWVVGPMGWRPMVALGQALHVQLTRPAVGHLFRLPGPGLHKAVTLAAVPSAAAIATVIDDTLLFGTNKEVLVAVRAALALLYGGAGLVVNWGKDVPPRATGEVVALGMSVFPAERRLLPSAARATALLVDTRALLAQAVVSGVELARLVGAWVWVILLFRPLLSVLVACYRFMGLVGEACAVPWPSVRRELAILCQLLPMVRVDLSRPWSSLVIASDASLSGGAVAYSRGSPARSRTLADDLPAFSPAAAFLVQDGLTPPMQEVRARHWRVACAWPWRSPSHINALEAEAAVQAMLWLAKSPEAFGRRVLLLSDSMAAGGAAAKGRSSSRLLRRPLQRMAAWQLLGDFRPVGRWLPSQAMPADAASRRFAQPERAERDFVKRVGVRGGDGAAGDGPWVTFRRPSVGFLLEALVPGSRAKYARNLLHLERFVLRVCQAAPRNVRLGVWFSSLGAVDQVLVAFLAFLRRGRLPLSRFVVAFWALRKFNPFLSGIAFPGAYACLKAIGKVHVVVSALPMSMALLRAVCVLGGAGGRKPLYWLASLVAFDGLLRSKELLGLRKQDVRFPRGGGLPTLVLFNTKTGGRKAQFVTLRRVWVAELLRTRLAGLGPGDLVFPISSSSWRLWFAAARRVAGLEGFFTLHSFRHGGATELFLLGLSPEEILLVGRWASLSILNTYLQQCRLAILEGDTAWSLVVLGESLRCCFGELLSLLLVVLPL